MKKVNSYYICVSILSGVALVVFLSLVLTSIHYIRAIPFGLPESYSGFYISSESSLDSSDTERLFGDLKELAQNTNTTLIFDSRDLLGLAVYDPTDYYESYPLTYGYYYGKTIDGIIVLEDSFIHKTNMAHYVINNQTYTITGIYDKQHPLYTYVHEYIFDISKSTNYSGTYYLSSSHPDLVKDIKLIFENYELNYNQLDTNTLDTRTIIVTLFSELRYFLMAIGLMFIYIMSTEQSKVH